MPGAGVSTRMLPELFLGVAHVQALAEAFVRRILCELRERAFPPTQRTVCVSRILEPSARAFEVFVRRILCPASGGVPYALHRPTPSRQGRGRQVCARGCLGLKSLENPRRGISEVFVSGIP